MPKNSDGGSMYPSNVLAGNPNGEMVSVGHYPGASVRTVAAITAMQGMVGQWAGTDAQLGRDAVAIADALLAALEERG